MTDTTEKTEGWGVIRPGDRRAHYYRDMFSLCRRVGFYNGELSPDTFKSKDDCAACRKVLDREDARATAVLKRSPGKSNAEVAKQLDISEKTVQRARSELTAPK